MIKLVIGLFIGTGILGLVSIIVIWQGWVFATLWGWFIVPALNVKPISIAIGVGLIAITTMFYRPFPKEDYEDKSMKAIWGNLIGKIIGVNVIPLFIGWLAKLAMGA